MTTDKTTMIPQSDLLAAYRRAGERQAHRVKEGATVVGYKVGFTNTSQWAGMGISAPMWGALYDDVLVEADEVPFTFSLSAIQGPRIEPELVVHFYSTPDPDAGMQQLMQCIDWVAAGFEIVVSPADGSKATVVQAIANGGMHGALLVGQPLPVEELGSDPVQALANIHAELYCNGVLKDSGASVNVMGHPLNAVMELMQGLKRKEMAPLKAGDTVTTGTMTAAYPIAAGERWTATLKGAPLHALDVVFE